ncbi:MAG: vitamin K epoxide reductase family protein [Syntrophales bacterium]
MKIKKTIFAPYLMLVFAFIGMAIASYDVYAIYNNQLLWCPPPIDGCNTVAYSPHGRIHGVPIGALGLIFYLVMLALAAFLAFGSSSRRSRLVVLLYAVIGVLFSIYFFYLDLAFIHAFCIYCLISAVLTGLLLIYAIAHFRALTDGQRLTALKSWADGGSTCQS